jgi:TonB family protein
MIEVVLANILSYSEQIAILVGVAAALAALLKLAPRARLHCFQVLLACCLVIPFAQPWRVPAVATNVTTSTRVLTVIPPPATAPERWRPSATELIAGIIAAGIIVRLIIIALGMLRLRRYVENARFIPTAFPFEKERTGAWPDVFISEELKGPVTFGLFRPAMLVPARWMHNESIAYHELLHVRRRDWAFTVVEELIRAILWFHPAAWWLIGQIQLAREEVVDREVILLMQSRERYIDTLLAIAEAKAGLDLAPAPLFLKKRHLRRRVAALLKEVNMSKLRTATSLAGFAAIVAVAGWMAIRSFPLHAAPQTVRDSPGVKVQQDEIKLLHRTPVRYPQEALRKGIQGSVIVEATLDQKGEVTDAQVLNGPQELRKAALESVLQWHYNLDAGVPPKVQVAIDFVLPARRAPESSADMGPLPPPPITRVVSQIDMSRLPQPLRDKVAGRLPIHIGQQLSPEDTKDVLNALAAMDEHLRLGIKGSGDSNGVMVFISLDDSTGPPQAPARIRVGGNVQAMNLINKVAPVYPPLAKQARVQGTVRFTAYIGKDGHVENLEVVSGHPLLIVSALEAVKQWVYKPTLLNGEPVDVVTQIDVNFTLSE